MDSATCSRPLRWLARSFLVVALAAIGPADRAEGVVFHSQEEALKLAFPDADDVRKRMVILSAEQEAEITRLARSELETRIIKLYTGWKGGQVVGYAYIDVHTIRTKPEAFLVVLDPEGNVRSLRVLAFYEPLDYLPTDRWFRQFDGKPIGEPLRVGRDIHGILGATLSARAVADSVRRVQAFYQVLVGTAEKAPPAAPAVGSGPPPDRDASVHAPGRDAVARAE